MNVAQKKRRNSEVFVRFEELALPFGETNSTNSNNDEKKSRWIGDAHKLSEMSVWQMWCVCVCVHEGQAGSAEMSDDRVIKWIY